MQYERFPLTKISFYFAYMDRRFELILLGNLIFCFCLVPIAGINNWVIPCEISSYDNPTSQILLKIGVITKFLTVGSCTNFFPIFESMPILWTIELLPNLHIFLRTDSLRVLRPVKSSFNEGNCLKTLENCTTYAFRHLESKNHINIDIKIITSEVWLSKLPLVGC